jgi:hypothetical protein
MKDAHRRVQVDPKINCTANGTLIVPLLWALNVPTIIVGTKCAHIWVQEDPKDVAPKIEGNTFRFKLFAAKAA